MDDDKQQATDEALADERAGDERRDALIAKQEGEKGKGPGPAVDPSASIPDASAKRAENPSDNLTNPSQNPASPGASIPNEPGASDEVRK